MSIIKEIKDTDEFVSKATAVYGNKYEYPLTIFRGYNVPTQIRCRIHGDVTIIPIDFISYGQGCPVCWKNKPHGEQSIYLILKENGINFTIEHKFSDLKYKDFLRFDFYLPDLNYCIEYQGIQHFQPVEQFGGEETFKECTARDNLKRDYCKNKHIDLLEIRYDEDIKEKLKPVIELQYDFMNSNFYSD